LARRTPFCGAASRADSLKPGTEITVDGYQAKDSALRANGRDVTLPDGKKLFAGSPVADAPYKRSGQVTR